MGVRGVHPADCGSALRLAEFDGLFATALRGQQRMSPTVLRWFLDPASEATVRDLTGREDVCCSFFSFTLAASGRSCGWTSRCRPRTARFSTRSPTEQLRRRRRERATQQPGRRRSRVNPQTLRYYERRGLLAEPERSLGGHRLYPPDTVALLHVIKAAQRLGFTLDEVAELLAAGRRHPTADLRQFAIDKIAEVDARIADLTAIRATLTDVVDARCDSLTNCTCADCPMPLLTIGTPSVPTDSPPDPVSASRRNCPHTRTRALAVTALAV
ncbi:MerR family DNA-binding protein [Micromonospora sp. M12]